MQTVTLVHSYSLYSVRSVYDNSQLQLVVDCGRLVTRHWTPPPPARYPAYQSFPGNKRIPQNVTIPIHTRAAGVVAAVGIQAGRANVGPNYVSDMSTIVNANYQLRKS